jgi:hypothetical protein
MSICPCLCFFVCSFIHCVGNMFLLIPTQVQLQTGIQVSCCIISFCFCICLFVYLSVSPFVCFFVCSFIHCTGNMFLLIPTQVQLQTGIQVSYCIISLCFCICLSISLYASWSVCLFVPLSVCLFICLFFHPLHRQYVSLNPDTSPTSDGHSSKVYVCFLSVSLSACLILCTFVCSFIHCTYNMSLLILMLG